MMTHPLRGLLLLALVVLVVVPLAAAQAGGSIAINQVDAGRHPAMTALVSVQDGNGVPIPDLDAGTFEIVEDGRTSFPPDAVSTQVNPDAVVSIALMIDLSGSMQGKPLQEAQTASKRLLDALLESNDDPDRVAFFGINRPISPDDLTYNDQVEVPFGNDKNKVLNVINFLTIDANRPTPLYDALFRVVRLTAQQGGRRAIIVITDGIDTVSTLKADDPITEANRNNIPIFPISLSTNRVDENFLQRLAVRTGGTYRKAPAPEEFSALFQQVLDQMKLQYKLDYTSRLAQDGTLHSVLIRVRSPRVQGFDEQKFELAAAPVAATVAATAVPATVVAQTTAPAATPPPAPTVVPAASGGTTMQDRLDTLITFVQNNPLPAALIAIAVLLLIVLLVLLFVWFRRRGAAAVETPVFEAGDGIGDWQTGPPPAAPLISPGTVRAVGGAQPTIAADSSSASATTGAGAMTGPTFAPPPPPFSPLPPLAAQAGETRIIQRAPTHVALLIDRKNPTQRFDLGESTDIGRGQSNTVVLTNNTVSRQHARIRLDAEQFVLYDLGSANGTQVNGVAVAEPVPLHDGDMIQFGELEFAFKQLT